VAPRFVENLWTHVLKIDNSKLIFSNSRSCQLFKNRTRLKPTCR